MPCGLVPSRESQREALKSRKRPGFPAPLQSAQTVHCRVSVSFPSAQPGALLAAAAFYSPPAFVWVRAPTTGRGGVQGRVWCRAAPKTLEPQASAPPGFASVPDEGLRSAARCCLRSPPPGAAVAAAPPARAARWYSRAPKNRWRGLRAAQRPLWVNPRLCKGPRRGPLPGRCRLSEVPASQAACTLLPVRPVLAGHQPPGHSRASPGPLQRELPSPGSWHRPFLPPPFTSLAPEPRAMPAPGPGFPPALVHDLPVPLVHRP